MGLIGFALPTILNKMLKTSVEKEKQQKGNNNIKLEINNQIFDKFKHF